MAEELNPFCLNVKVTLMHYPETPSSYLAMDDLAGLLSQIARVPVWPINRTTWDAKLFLIALVDCPVDCITV